MKQASKEENRKQEVQLWEFAVDQLHIILDWTTSISISASTRLDANTPPPVANPRSEQTQTRDPLNFGPCKADWLAAFVIK